MGRYTVVSMRYIVLYMVYNWRVDYYPLIKATESALNAESIAYQFSKAHHSAKLRMLPLVVSSSNPENELYKNSNPSVIVATCFGGLPR